MGFLDVVGELTGFSDQKGWSLVGQDPGFTQEFKGEFISENMTESVGANINETSALNTEKPEFTWLHGEGEPFTFTARIFAHDSFKNVKQQIELLKSFAKRNTKLRRAPIFLFTAGTELGFTCFVRRVRIAYDELRSDGSIRGAIINVSLEKIQDTVTENAATSLASQIKFAAGIVAAAAGIAQTISRLITIPGGSLHTIDRTVVVKQGATFESIAQAEYGDALLGDILRRAQPELAELTPGDRVQLVEPTEIAVILVTQQSVALKDTPENAALEEEFFELRDRKTTIFV